MKADKTATERQPDETESAKPEPPKADEAEQTASAAEATEAEAKPEAKADRSEAADQPDPAAEAGELKNKLMRTLAEMENLRRRTERELADARQYAVANFARDMLTVGDNLRRALDAMPKELRESGDKAMDSLIDGIEVTARGLDQTLAKFGVRPIDPKGQKFDPSVHQAMYEVETGDIAPGMVAAEVQTGYMIGDRVLRPAMVAVAKRPAKPADEASDKEAAAEPEPATARAESGGGGDKPAS